MQIQSRPTLLFFHGTGGSPHHFNAQIEHFKGSYPTYTFEFRGGSLEAWQAQVKEEWNKKIINAAPASARTKPSIVLIGHSVGGTLALALANDPAFSGVVGVAMIDTAFLIKNEVHETLRELSSALRTAQYKEILKSFVETHFFSPTDDPYTRQNIVEKMLELPQATFLNLFEASGEFNAEAALRRLSCPLLYLHGGAPTDLERVSKLVKSAFNAIQIPRVGHYPMIFSPEEVNRAMDTWLLNLI